MDIKTLNRYYDNEVKMTRDETRRNVDIIRPIVQEILEYVHARDRRFQKQPLNVGSYYSHLKVSTADEFDFGVVLDIPNLVWGQSGPRYYGFDKSNNATLIRTAIALPDPPPGQHFTQIGGLKAEWTLLEQGEGCMTFDDDIIPIKVKRRFKKLVAEAVNQRKFAGVVSAARLSDSPATMLTITHPTVGYQINVDLCPMIEAKLEFLPDFGFPRIYKQWPSPEKIRAIKNLGINEVAKHPFYWNLSFAVCEKELLDKIDVDGGCRKKSQRIMKKLRQDCWCPKGIKQELTSYHLKNTLFWECEDHPYTIEWLPDMLGERIKSMTQRLLGYLQRQWLPLYFHTRVNLLESKDKEVLRTIADRIYAFLQNPEQWFDRLRN